MSLTAVPRVLLPLYLDKRGPNILLAFVGWRKKQRFLHKHIFGLSSTWALPVNARYAFIYPSKHFPDNFFFLVYFLLLKGHSLFLTKDM